MTLTPWDMFVIQTAFDRYEKRFPDKPSPSPAEALAWHATQSGRKSQPDVRGQIMARSCGLSSRASQSIPFRWNTIVLPRVGVVFGVNKR
jgi:hypothetical protein